MAGPMSTQGARRHPADEAEEHQCSARLREKLRARAELKSPQVVGQGGTWWGCSEPLRPPSAPGLAVQGDVAFSFPSGNLHADTGQTDPPIRFFSGLFIMLTWQKQLTSKGPYVSFPLLVSS